MRQGVLLPKKCRKSVWTFWDNSLAFDLINADTGAGRALHVTAMFTTRYANVAVASINIDVAQTFAVLGTPTGSGLMTPAPRVTQGAVLVRLWRTGISGRSRRRQGADHGSPALRSLPSSPGRVVLGKRSPYHWASSGRMTN